MVQLAKVGEVFAALTTAEQMPGGLPVAIRAGVGPKVDPLKAPASWAQPRAALRFTGANFPRAEAAVSALSRGVGPLMALAHFPLEELKRNRRCPGHRDRCRQRPQRRTYTHPRCPVPGGVAAAGGGGTVPPPHLSERPDRPCQFGPRLPVDTPDGASSLPGSPWPCGSCPIARLKTANGALTGPNTRAGGG